MKLKLLLIVSAVSLSALAAWGADAPPQPRSYGGGVIAITFGDSFNADAGMMPGSYKVNAAGNPLAVAKVGRDSKVAKFIEQGWPYKPVMQHTIFLVLESPLKDGDAYTVSVAPGVLGQPAEFKGKFDSAAPAPDLIKICQVGYLPGDPKKLAYLGGFLGDLGPLPLKSLSGKFRVIDLASNKSVFEGMAALSKPNDPESGEDVYWLDISAVKTAGKYVIEVEGIGRSYPFPIADNVYAQPLVTALRGLYHQRCGTALTAPYTTWTYGVCHRMPAKLVTYYNSMDGEAMKDLSKKVDPSGKTIDGWGGWHDAGDYDRMLSRHIETVGELLNAFEANANRFADSQCNIPESGNKTPDILDEAKWGLDWMERMYDTSDSAFYYRIESVDYGWSMPDKDNQQLYCMAKYPYYSALAGVPFARAARVFAPYDAKLAAHYMEIAQACLKYAQQQQAADKRMPRALALLAAEIYCANGDPAAHRLFLDGKERESLAYALCKRADVDKAVQQQSREAFVRPAEKIFARQRTQGYVCCVPDNAAGVHALMDASTLLHGYLVSERTDFLLAAQLSLDSEFGANPLGYSWITGIGSKYPLAITQHPSEFDGIDEPVPGIPINGATRMTAKDGSTHVKLFAQKLYPAAEQYPMMRNYSELPRLPSISEFTHFTQARAVFALSFFAPAASAK